MRGHRTLEGVAVVAAAAALAGCATGMSAQSRGGEDGVDAAAVYVRLMDEVFSGRRTALDLEPELRAAEANMRAASTISASEMERLATSKSSRERAMAAALVEACEISSPAVVGAIACGYDANRSPLERYLAARVVGFRPVESASTCPERLVEAFSAEGTGLFIASAMPALKLLDQGHRVRLAVSLLVNGNVEVRAIAFLLVSDLGPSAMEEVRAGVQRSGSGAAVEALRALEAL